MAKPVFKEDILTDRHSTLDADPSYEIDFLEMDRRLGWSDPGQPDATPLSESLALPLSELGHATGRCKTFQEAGKLWLRVEKAADESTAEGGMILRLSDWVCDINRHSGNQLHRSDAYRIGKRVVAFFWLLRADYFDGLSLRKLAAKLGISAPVLSEEVSAAARHFGLTCRGQSRLAKQHVRRDRAMRKRMELAMNKPADAAHLEIGDQTEALIRGIFGEGTDYAASVLGNPQPE